MFVYIYSYFLKCIFSFAPLWTNVANEPFDWGRPPAAKFTQCNIHFDLSNAITSPITDQKIVITFIPVCDWTDLRALKYVCTKSERLSPFHVLLLQSCETFPLTFTVAHWTNRSKLNSLTEPTWLQWLLHMVKKDTHAKLKWTNILID